ncbi:ATP-binding protein [Kitasatospora sp. NPDC057223]|uniref:ATP-binding protein n=1 Tax=Kitasatospora sp. NPDC057223 TaxID=3346055 RepID=UPI00362A167F
MHPNHPSPPAPRAATWPLDGRRETPARARELACAFLDQCSSPLTGAGRADVLLALSELVTNAVRHAPGPCTLTLTEHTDSLTVAVRDGSTAPPVPRPPDLMAGTGGFGWHLLRTLSEEVEIRRHQDGKTVAVRVPARRATGRTAAPDGAPLPADGRP